MTADAVGGAAGGHLWGAVTLRRHWLFAVLLAAGVVLRGLAGYAYWPALELNGDSYSYLRLETHTGVGHPAGYPVLLRWLSATGSLGSVTVLQHGLGVLIGVVGYAFLLRLGVRRWLAALAATPILLDGYQINVEHFILADTLAQATLMLSVVLVLWPRDDRMGLALRFGVAAGLLGALTILTRFSSAAILVVPIAYLLVRRRWRTLLAFALSAGLGLALYAAWNHHEDGTSGLGSANIPFLYGRVAPFATCDYHLAEDLRGLCPTGPTKTRPGPEFYVWSVDSPLRTSGNGPNVAARARRFATTVIKHQPGDYLATVVKDTARYVVPGHDDNPRDFMLQRYQFPLATDTPPPLLHVAIANQTFKNKAISSKAHESAGRVLRRYQDVGYTQGPLLLAGLIGGALCGASLLWSGGRRPARWAGLALAVTGLGVLLVPSVSVGFSYRYLLPVLPLLPAAGALALDLVIDAATRRWGHAQVANAGTRGGSVTVAD